MSQQLNKNSVVGSTLAYKAGSSGSWVNPNWNSASGSWNSIPSSGSSSGSLGSFDDMSDYLQSIVDKNNAWSAAQADKQMAFQTASADKAMKFNSDEAAKNREWQEYMSNTAHQREVKDLIAAGLNPVLSSLGGNGAAVTSGSSASGYAPSGAKGDTDTSLTSGIVSLFSNLLMAQTQLANQALSANTNLAVAEKYTEMQKYTSELQSMTTLNATSISAAAQRYAAQTNAEASKVVASIHAAAQKYGYDLSAMTQKEIAQFNASVNKDLAEMGYQHDFDIKEAYPSNLYQAASSMIGQLTGGEGASSAKDIASSLWDSITRPWTSSGMVRGGSR